MGLWERKGGRGRCWADDCGGGGDTSMKSCSTMARRMVKNMRPEEAADKQRVIERARQHRAKSTGHGHRGLTD